MSGLLIPFIYAAEATNFGEKRIQRNGFRQFWLIFANKSTVLQAEFSENSEIMC